MKRILLVDFANSFFSHFHSKDTDKAWRFLCNIRELVSQFNIDKILFANEGGKSQYRLTILPTYKGAREEKRSKDDAAEKARYWKFKNEEMKDALDLAKMLGIETVQLKGVEADDVLAWIANHINTEEYQLLILSTDYDIKQVLRKGVVIAGYNIALMKSLSANERLSGKIWQSYKDFVTEYGIEPKQYGSVLAIAGDVADSIPSPKGLGEGAALKMIQKHKDIYGVEENLATLGIPRLPKKVLEEMQRDFSFAHRNLLLTNLIHSPETEKEIFGEQGIKYLEDVLDRLEEPSTFDKSAFREYCFEYGKISVIDKLDFWLQPFE